MPYNAITELPTSVRNVLPKHAQDIYKEAFNSAFDEYKDPKDRRDDADREEVAHRVAWNAVKSKYAKGNDSKWHPKE
jgi:cation transport regulator